MIGGQEDEALRIDRRPMLLLNPAKLHARNTEEQA